MAIHRRVARLSTLVASAALAWAALVAGRGDPWPTRAAAQAEGVATPPDVTAPAAGHSPFEPLAIVAEVAMMTGGIAVVLVVRAIRQR
ncbi:MAG TPA: hypothetical protein VEZ14_08840 [Dehalococcoidia bacterium]|nr:hypothetical protein [Dehalococcoidia bacterium]